MDLCERSRKFQIKQLSFGATRIPRIGRKNETDYSFHNERKLFTIINILRIEN